MSKFMNLTEIAVLAGLSESTLRAYIARGDFPQALFQHRGRHYWAYHVVSEALSRLKLPRPLADRKSHLPATAEMR